MDLVEAPTGPWRQVRVVQHPFGGTCCGPRRRGRDRRLAEAAECRPWEGGECEYGAIGPRRGALTYHRASRPKPAKLLTNLRLRSMVQADLAKKYSPEQIAGR